MVVCKYFQQGNCRFGQYCKFEHTFGNRTKTFGEEKNIALLVAEEVLLAERGGQWLLSCYGPFKERKCIPGMEDISPEEVRWEMYNAQKNGTADQINAQFQQMCEAMKAKRDALKNPTPAIAQLLEEIQNSGSENLVFGDASKMNKGTYPFSTPQLTLTNNQTSNVFGQKTFAAPSNPFGTSTFNSAQSSSSIFGRPTTNTTTSVFGGKPTFGSAPLFGGTSTTGSSIFGGTTKIVNAPFGSVQNTPTFGVLANQTSSIFGGATTSQSTFGQPATFGVSNVQSSGNSFLNPQGTQSSLFGGASTTSGNVFGGATVSSANTSVFGAPTVSSAPASTGVFGQSNTTAAAFGGAPVFGGAAGFGAQTSSIFGGQTAFGGATTAPSSNNVFGNTSASNSSFGQIAQSSNTNAFAGAGTTVGTTGFEAAPNATPFGVPTSTAAGPFANTVFATSATSAPGPFGSTKGTTFGFAAAVTESNTNVFGTTSVTSTTQSPFGTSNFVNSHSSNFIGATPTNPFGAKTQSSPFGTAAQTQSSPFGSFAKPDGNAFGVSVTLTIDETAYSLADSLTDDEKAAYRMNQFTEGHIPLKPPTKELK